MSSRSLRVVLLAVCAGLCATSCQRERRDLRPAPASAVLFGNTAIESQLLPGGPTALNSVPTPNEGNAFAISEGQRLFNWYNCSGCHANGGGGIGPPLIKTEWIYGSDPANIFDTIVKGRPNGMPSWGGKIPEYQIWQIVAFVRSLANMEPKSATPERPDTIEQKSDTIVPSFASAK